MTSSSVASIAAVVLLGLLVRAQTDGDASGSSGDRLYQPHCLNQGNCSTTSCEKEYVVITSIRANWFQAWIICARHGRQLASVQNEYEEQLLLQAVVKAGAPMEIWLGATDLMGPRGEFFWMSNGQPVNYTNWNTGEPNFAAQFEPCLLLHRVGANYRWFNEACYNNRHFACERFKTNATDELPVDWKIIF